MRSFWSSPKSRPLRRSNTLTHHVTLRMVRVNSGKRNCLGIRNGYSAHDQKIGFGQRSEGVDQKERGLWGRHYVDWYSQLLASFTSQVLDLILSSRFAHFCLFNTAFDLRIGRQNDASAEEKQGHRKDSTRSSRSALEIEGVTLQNKVNKGIEINTILL